MAARHLLTPRRCRRVGSLAAATVLLLVGAPQVGARVFLKLGTSERIVARLREAGGTVAYESDVAINGGRGQLTVTGFTQGAHEVGRLLRRAAGVDPAALTGGGVLNATITDEEGVVRLLAFHLAPQGRTLVVTIAQTAADYRQSQARPDRAAAAGAVAPYPDSSPRLVVSDEKVRMSLSVSDTAAAPETVHAAMAAQLKRAGWTPLLPDSEAAAPMRVYGRGAEICCVHVGPAPGAAGGNVITLLHKQQGIE